MTFIDTNKEENNLPVRDTQARKYQITINNPLKKEIPYTHEKIKEEVSKLASIIYWCMCDEIGAEGTPHTHIFLLSGGSPIRFSTLRNRFPSGHIESAYGSAVNNRLYLLKEGKWKNTNKAETSVEGSFEEFGEIPHSERMSQKGELQFIFDMVQSGFSTVEILRMHPEVLPYLEKIDKARQLLIEEEYKNTFRKLEVSYVFGKTDSGKTRHIMETEGYSNVYRVTDYSHRAWDRYQNQKTVCFEEFHSSFPIQSMLIYLDGYPCVLPARYNQKTACFLKVFITTNIPLENQYVNIQKESPETWKAFLRRIHKVIHYQNDGKIKSYTLDAYLNRWQKPDEGSQFQQMEIPFDDSCTH